MRHMKKGRKLGRVSSHRKALLKNLVKSLVKHEKIVTTTAKAKDLRPVVEKIITRAIKGSSHDRRLVFARVGDKETVTKLFEDIALRYKNRNGGYTRIYKLYQRRGDSAEMSMIELVEENLVESTAGASDKKEDKAAE